MGNYKKKTWTDPVIKAANRAETVEEKRLCVILEGIILIKESPDLTKFPPKPIEVNLDTGEGAEEADRIWRTHGVMHDLMRILRKYHETPKFVWDYWTHKDKPHLALISDPGKRIFSDLIQNLQDPEWVSALRQCPECHNFILSNSKWVNKFCSTKCKEKYYGRKNKKNGKKKREIIEVIEHEMESKIVECPSNSDTPDRIHINKKRFEVIMRCPKCRLMILGGKFDNYLKDYSGPEKCPDCNTPGLRYFLTTSDREEYEYRISAWEELVKTYKSKG